MSQRCMQRCGLPGLLSFGIEAIEEVGLDRIAAVSFVITGQLTARSSCTDWQYGRGHRLRDRHPFCLRVRRRTTLSARRHSSYLLYLRRELEVSLVGHCELTLALLDVLALVTLAFRPGV